MDFMNLFSKVGKEIIEEENERESSFKESEELNAGLSVDDIAEIEDLKRSVVTLAKKVGNTAISNELGIPLDKIRDWTYQYANNLRLYRDSEETCEDDKVISSNKVVITKLGKESLTDATLEPLQNEKGILSFIINFDKYTLNVNSEEARKDCVRKLKMLTGADFAWFREERGLKHWVLYNTEMYEIKDFHLHYKESSLLVPVMPINATSCYAMFRDCSHLPTLNFSDFDTSNVVDMDYMFSRCSNFITLDLSGFNTSNVTEMRSMFEDCKELLYLDLPQFDTSKVTDMNSMFYNCSKATFIDVANFDTSNVIDMSYMFAYCKSLIKLNLSKFDTSNVVSSENMFYYCESLETIYISYKWSLNKVIDAKDMFKECYSLPNFNQENTDAEMSKPIEDGGYLTLKK